MNTSYKTHYESTRFIVVEEIGLNVLQKKLVFLKSIIALLEPPANTLHRYVGTTMNSTHEGLETADSSYKWS